MTSIQANMLFVFLGAIIAELWMILNKLEKK